MGRVERIWVKRFHGGPMDEVEVARLVPGRGLEGSADADGRRQVTILSAERWARAQDELGAEVDPALRRANLLVSGVDLTESRGRVLAVGTSRIRVKGETRPCRLMDEQHPGLQDALHLDWGGGAHGEVLSGGPVAVGDPVNWEPDRSARRPD